MKKGLQGWIARHRLLLGIVAAIVILILILFGTQIALFLHFFIGNDIVIKLTPDKEALFLKNGQEENLQFEASVTTNPFCSALCTSLFEEVSNNQVIEQDQFTLRPGLPLKKEYLVTPHYRGEGQELYRFSVECHSVRTFFCHTAEEPTTRTVLVAVWHGLTPDEEQLKNRFNVSIEIFQQNMSELEGERARFFTILGDLEERMSVTELKIQLSRVNNGINLALKNLKEAQVLWGQQDYSALQKLVPVIENDIVGVKNNSTLVNLSMNGVILRYNTLIDQLQKKSEELQRLRSLSLTNQTLVGRINTEIGRFNETLAFFAQQNPLAQKEEHIHQLTEKVTPFILTVDRSVKEEVLRREIELDTAYDALCQTIHLCVSHPSIEERADELVFDLNATCAQTESLRQLHRSLNMTFENGALNQSYPSDIQFLNNITLKVRNIKQNATNDYWSHLPGNKSNTELLQEILTVQLLSDTAPYGIYNLTPALVLELVRQAPRDCIVLNETRTSLVPFNMTHIQEIERIPAQLNLSFGEHLPQCCLFGVCSACCMNEQCRSDPAFYPIVFIHGHAFNKDVSAEYSLDAFNKIQKRLEQKGYLNAGAISLYTSRTIPEGFWGMTPAHLTLKASYYYDIFKEPENYVVIQTKSENIDTYAIRLKELLDTIQYKTGRSKVIIVAHSMGGLVTRRYLQLFGSDGVAAFIMIGTPNKGVVGQVADYCSLIGEKNECKDMNVDSVFMKKLNDVSVPSIPITNVVGTGCAMREGVGDGVVLRDNARLRGVDNIIVNGTCEGIAPLHTQLLDIDLYPLVYDIIARALDDVHGEHKKNGNDS